MPLMMADQERDGREEIARPPSRALTVMLAALWATIMIPLVAHGGFVCDDWMVLSHAVEHPTWRENLRSWFPLFAARPLAPVLLATTSTLLPPLPSVYVILHLSLLASAMGLVARIWRRFFGAGAAAGFFILATLPSVASTWIFSPGMQQLASAAYLIWAVSLYLTAAAAEAKTLLRRIGLATAVAALLLSGLILYEIFLPLLLIQWALPLALRWEKVETRPEESVRPPAAVLRHEAIFWAVVIAVPVVAAVILQKWVLPSFAPDMSRLQFAGSGMAVRAAVYWLTAVLVQLPLLWTEGILRFSDAWDWWTLIAAAAFLLVLGPSTQGWVHGDRTVSQSRAVCGGASASRQGRKADQAGRLLRIACWVAAGSSIFLFVLSNSYAAVFGYDNRKLSSFWVASALAVSAGLGQKPLTVFRGGNLGGWVFFLCVFALNTTSFLIQRNHYLLSWHMQRTILEDMASSLPPDQGRPITVLAAVPAVVPGNYNDECVFTRPWDIGNAARMRTGGRIGDAAPIYPWLIRQDRVRFSPDGIVIDDLWAARYGEDFWLFGWKLSAAEIRPVSRRFLGIPLLPASRYPRLDAVAAWIPIDSHERLQAALNDWFEQEVCTSAMSRSAVVTQTAAEWFRERFLGKPATDHGKGTTRP